MLPFQTYWGIVKYIGNLMLKLETRMGDDC